MNRFSIIVFILILPTTLFGQISVDQSLSPEEIVQQHLVGEGVEVQNLTFNGADPSLINSQIGIFSGGWGSIGIEDGIILATGDASVAEGPNDLPTAHIPIDEELTEEPDLAQLMGGNAELNDVAILEFDFLAEGDTLRFSYVFASEEYNEHTCSPYNDAFGFFISGPGIEGDAQFENNALNLAKIPGTNTPVAINTVNRGIPGEYGSMAICNAADVNWQSNSTYFVDNEGNPDPTTTQFDGFTTVFNVEIPVVCGGTYHIKMAVADAVDGKNDSAVFLKSESFSSKPPLEVEVDVVQPFSGNTALEGCSSYQFRLTRSDSSSTEVIYLESDYADENPEIFPDFPDSLVFYPEQGYMDWMLPLAKDVVHEGQRIFDLTFLQTAACGLDTSETVFDLLITDVENLEVNYSDTIRFSCDEVAQVEVGVSGGYPPYTINWEDGYEGFQFGLSPFEMVTLSASVQDQCNLHSTNIEVVVIPEEYPPLEIVLPEEVTYNCIESLSLTPLVTGGRGDYQFEWILDGEFMESSQTFNSVIEEGDHLSLVVTDGCSEPAQFDVNLVSAENPISVDLGEDIQGYCNTQVSFYPEVSGGFGELNYLWKINNGEAGTSGSFSFTPSHFSLITLEVVDACGQYASDTAKVFLDNPPMEVYLPSDTSVCSGERINLSPVVSGGYGEYSYFWEERGSSSSEISIIPDRDITYTLIVKDECFREVESEINIEVVDVVADFEFDYENDLRPIRNLSTEGVFNFWTLPDGTQSEEFEPTFDPILGQNQPVVLEVSHPAGCRDEKLDFYEPPMNLFIPNAFTPDGDGLNDVFTAVGSFIEEYDLWVFDRWGNVIFHSRNPEYGWDGSDASDEFAGQSLVYSYRVRAVGYSGEVIDKKGTVQVLK